MPSLGGGMEIIMNKLEYIDQMIKAREEYIHLIKQELLGPGSEFSIPDCEHELISSSPTSRYSIGILFPQNIYVKQDSEETLEINELNAHDEELEGMVVGVEELNDMPKAKQEFLQEQSYNDVEEENLDEEVCMSSQYKQSSMGITFIVEGDTDVVRGSLSFATYRKATVSDCVIPYKPDDGETYKIPIELEHKMKYDASIKAIRLLANIDYKEARRIFEQDTLSEQDAEVLRPITYRFIDLVKNGYVREPHLIPEFVLNFKKGNYVECEPIEELEKLDIKISALKTCLKDNAYSITIMLVNAKDDNIGKPYNCLFQSKIEIRTDINNFVFLDNNPNMDWDNLDDEEKSLKLLYRNKKNYATGLGTSADWKIDGNGQGSVWTEYFPQVEVPQMDFTLPTNNLVSDDELSMKYFSDLNDIAKEDKLLSLENLVNLYKTWVDNLETIAQTLDPKYCSIAAANIRECKRAYGRMDKGISILRENEKAYTAFMLANRAMFMQRIHLQMQSDMADREHYPGDELVSEKLHNMDYYEEDDAKTRWRPFQIAFILMDIESIVDEKSEDRNIVDLIWFPTGGGKTEAYLGLTAVTIFYRRLAYLDLSDGTAVIMRYTLRLLAAQQFTRASTLICACEYIRKDCLVKRSKYPAYSLGKTPITIGLWIGGAHIPNNNTGEQSAQYFCEKLTKSTGFSIESAKVRYNKFQVLKCPWCGTKMVRDYKDRKEYGKWGYQLKDGKHFFLFCPHEECDFTSRLPIQIIDEELFDNPPTLLFGTVDKFAMLPWDGRIGSFFAVGSENRCPELIIQDELHLISGSLGTMVGLYETAIDALCGQKGIKAKIIASTATIRKAKEQCSALYNREVVQFPAPGLNADDSFFAKEARVDLKNGIYGRRYIGVQPSGKTKAMVEIRILATMLQTIYSMNLSDEEIKDKYWTLTAYYNSLKDLGKASSMIDDDVKDFIIRTANRHFEKRRFIGGADELTSRVTTTELNETLDKLEKVKYSSDKDGKHRFASNILLATNMISVGIDVARLNTMVMVGQPKLTSEYIQASSRVGRSYPGMVVVQYDSTKSRDRSHYEQFRPYHESFYKYVEPTGATPFSKPARERALHAVLTAILRNKAGMKEDKSAQLFDENRYELELKEIEEFIVSRVQTINSRLDQNLNDDSESVREEIKEFFSEWQEKVEECENQAKQLYFGRKFILKEPGKGEERLLRPYKEKCYDNARDTMTSMRNVDSSVTGSIIIWED